MVGEYGGRIITTKPPISNEEDISTYYDTHRPTVWNNIMTVTSNNILYILDGTTPLAKGTLTQTTTQVCVANFSFNYMRAGHS